MLLNVLHVLFLLLKLIGGILLQGLDLLICAVLGLFSQLLSILCALIQRLQS